MVYEYRTSVPLKMGRVINLNSLVSRQKQGLHKKLIDLQYFIAKIRVNGFELFNILNHKRLSKKCSLFKAMPTLSFAY